MAAGGIQWGRTATLAMLMSLTGAGPVLAEESVGDRFQRMLDPSYRALDAEDEPDEEEDEDPTWLRIELTGQLLTPFFGKVKKGPDALTHGFKPDRDAHLPSVPVLGFGAALDVRGFLFSWASIGGVFYEARVDGPRRHVHYEGVHLNSRFIPGGTRVETRITVRYAELSFRYWWTNSKKWKIWFGIGPAWTSYRIAFRGNNQRATSRIETVLGPALSYAIHARVSSLITLYLQSGIAISPNPSYVSDFRVGIRWHLTENLILSSSALTRTGLTSDWREQFHGGQIRSGHRWRRVYWSNFGIEFGLAFEL